MKIGIGTPGTSHTLSAGFLKEFGRRADAAGFSTITHLDRIVYTNHDPLIALTTIAAVTNRIRLQTSVLITPLRGAALVAKETATLDSISGGRLTLGMAVGSRRDDYAIAGADPSNRGRRFDEQLTVMHRLWSGDPPLEGGLSVGPRPVQRSGPQILIGGRVPAALRRVAKWGAGYVTGAVFSAETAKSIYDQVLVEWQKAGRKGTPRFVGTVACAIGQEQANRTAESIDHYYHYRGPGLRDGNASLTVARSDSRNNIPASITAIREVLKACEDIGMDEVIVRPGVEEIDQVDKLADLL